MFLITHNKFLTLAFCVTLKTKIKKIKKKNQQSTVKSPITSKQGAGWQHQCNELSHMNKEQGKFEIPAVQDSWKLAPDHPYK